MKLISVLAGLLTATAVVDGSAFADKEVYESLRVVPQGWHSIGVPKAEDRMFFRIALKSVCPILSLLFS
jgi:hypothetical protein